MRKRNINLTILGIILICLGIASNNLSNLLLPNDNTYNNNETNLKSAGFWEVADIYIDDASGLYNWAITEFTFPWCSGSGTWNDPYIIENVTVNGGGTDNCILIGNSSVYFRIENCTVYNTEIFYAGIRLENVNNSWICNSSAYNNYYGIELSYSSDNNTISGNTCDDGIYLSGSSDNIISGNDCSNNFAGDGIYLSGSSDNIISGNDCSNNGDDGIYLSGSSDNNTISNNICSYNDDDGIYLSGSSNNTILDNDCSNNGDDGIYLSGSSNNTISGNDCSNNGDDGIYLSGSSNNTISDNTCSYNYDGIELSYSSDNNTISNNTCSYNDDDGIYLSGSSDSNTISGNDCSNNDGYGICLPGSSNNTISGNNCSNNNFGILLSSSSDSNTISDNTCSNNNFGIYLLDSSDNIISGNDCSNNFAGDGIYLSGSSDNIILDNDCSYNDNGIYLYGSSDNNTISDNTCSNNYDNGIHLYGSSDNNILYLNIFIANNENAADDGVDNQWDNGSIGNYWDDYSGVDANDDGIGDTQYNIIGFAGSQDHYPIWNIRDEIPPTIGIFYPESNDLFGITAPSFNVEIYDASLDTMWYTLDNGLTNTTFTTNGTISQTLWDTVSNGTATWTFYANDSAGNIGFAEVTVVKTISQPNSPGIHGYNILLLLGIVSTIAVIIVKKRLNRLN